MFRTLSAACFVVFVVAITDASAEIVPFSSGHSRQEADPVVPMLSTKLFQGMQARNAEKPPRPYFDSPVIRGQSPTTFETPPLTAPSGQAFTQSDANNGYAVQDPFLYGPDPVLGGQPAPLISGVNGPQPYRMGFTPMFDYTFLGQAPAQSPASGHFESHAFNFDLAYTTPVGPGWVMTSTPQFGARWWEGTQTIDLPSHVYRFGWDITLASPLSGPWGIQGSFNPSINTDFENGIDSDAWNFDGNLMLFYRASPTLMLVGGVGYWDRVDGIFLPYAGIVANPSDRWEFRLMFPRSRISYFLGQFGDASNWLYASAEYHVESYQIGMPAGGREQIQHEDWRLALGLRSDHGWYDKFFEVGYVFGRQVSFKHGTPGFDLSDSVMIRTGVKF